MRRIPAILLCFFIVFQGFSQSERKISGYLLAQYNHTLYDYTEGNNPWGAGLGVQAFFNNKTRFRPTIEITGDVYLEDDKVLRSNPDGSFPENGNDVRGMVNLFAGASFRLVQPVYLSLTTGPSFINGNTFLGIKPAIGVYFSKDQRWTGKVSYINVFNRTKPGNEDFGSFNISIGIKLF